MPSRYLAELRDGADSPSGYQGRHWRGIMQRIFAGEQEPEPGR